MRYLWILQWSIGKTRFILNPAYFSKLTCYYICESAFFLPVREDLKSPPLHARILNGKVMSQLQCKPSLPSSLLFTSPPSLCEGGRGKENWVEEEEVLSTGLCSYIVHHAPVQFFHQLSPCNSRWWWLCSIFGPQWSMRINGFWHATCTHTEWGCCVVKTLSIGPLLLPGCYC